MPTVPETSTLVVVVSTFSAGEIQRIILTYEVR